MSDVPFEEKEVEGPANEQLASGAALWSPGQVLEEVVGFDVAMFTTSAAFWAARGHQTPPPGAVVQPTWWPAAAAGALQARAPPPFQLNVFLQYKRPAYLSRSNASEWASWNAPYFRFAITAHQQVALAACATALGTSGYVAYASPAFHARAALFTHVQNRTLVANLHFAPAAPLSGHGRYTYVNAATPGLAHSEPVKVKPLLFLNGNGDGGGPPVRRPPGGGGGRAPREVLAEARRAARAAIVASPTVVGSEQLFDAALQLALRFLEGAQVVLRQEIRDFIYVAVFSTMSGISWQVI